ncbi:hypothetical protein MKEN_00568200 [Mycena kentingensis (nom. inval.)]|nr:hypothetical protein MKEN_00568200 [Mycena kentingensis (nom. inval.)]
MSKRTGGTAAPSGASKDAGTLQQRSVSASSTTATSSKAPAVRPLPTPPPIQTAVQSPASPPTSPVSKLPRFLQSPTQRSRSASVDQPRPGSSASNSSSAGAPRRFLGGLKKDRERERIREAERAHPSAEELLAMADEDDSYAMASSPPSAYATARPRSRPDRAFSASTPPGSSSSHSSSSHGPHSPTASSTTHVMRSPSRLSAGDGGLTTRLSGWFSHLAGSTSDLSLTNTIGAAASLATSTSRTLASSTSKTPSRKRDSDKDKGKAVGSGGGILDKAVRYLLDGDANPDRSTAEIWIMGVRMEGWNREDEERFARAHDKHGHAPQPPSLDDNDNDRALPDPGPWPASFHAAFYAQVWCTYRAGFPEPIRDLTGIEVLGPPLYLPQTPHAHTPPPPGVRAPPMHSPTQSDASASSYASSSPSSSAHGHGHGHAHHSTSSHSTTSSTASTSSSKKKWWPLSLGNGGSKGWSSDAGWGCMLRTAQSLLATSVGRVGAPALQPTLPMPFPPTTPAEHASHARLLSWFADAPMAPFSVHRMALAGKKAGKDVGMWFGPSAAGTAVRTLVDGFPACGLGVAVAQDGTLYQTDVFAASHAPSVLLRSSASGSSHGHGNARKRSWGDRPVLLLLGIRLGLDGVNPVYYETIKTLFRFPQSVGIAGGRPSSSYYFVGVQGDGLFYLDPHHSRPTIPLRPYLDDQRLPVPEVERLRRSVSPEYALSSDWERSGSVSPELVQVHRAGSMSPDSASASRRRQPMTEDELVYSPRRDRQNVAVAGGQMTPAEEAHWVRAYSVAEMRTFHCERVRKMPMSGLDPSMLIGFLVRSEAEWVDLRRRIKELPRTIFAITDEPPSWPGMDDDDELEGISDPEEEPVVEVEMDEDEGSNASHVSSSHNHRPPHHHHHTPPAKTKQTHTHMYSDSASTTHSKSSSSQADTEDDPVGPVTPLPGSSFDLGRSAVFVADEDGGEEEEDFVDAGGEVDVEDDWVDPVSTPAPAPAAPVQVPVMLGTAKKLPSSSSGSASASSSLVKVKSTSGKSGSKGKKTKPVPVPVPSVHYPFPGSGEADADAEVQGEGTPRDRERDRNITVVPPKEKKSARRAARDGGRTQSGGVRGVLQEDP